MKLYTLDSVLMKNVFLGKVFLFVFILLNGNPILSQQANHPRVEEVESYITDKAFYFLRGRFPEMPLLVTVEIEPLRRQIKTQSRGAEELPFGILGDIETVDEWDDKTSTIFELLDRIRSANVNIKLSNQVTDEEINILRNDLFIYLSLIPARDKINFSRQDWKNTNRMQILAAVASAAIIILLMGLFLIIRVSINQLSLALKPKNNSSNENINQIQATPKISQFQDQSELKLHNEINGNLDESNRFDQRIAMREDMRLIIRRLNKQKVFPTLSDMRTFTDLAKNDPGNFGAIMLEFPKTEQEILFSKSPENIWLESFASAGFINIKCYHILENISRFNRDDLNPLHQEALIAAWRLGDDIVRLIRNLDKKDALPLLTNLPLDLSIKAAKKVFPGSWAFLLESDNDNKVLEAESTLKEIIDKAYEISPPNKFDAIEKYQSEKNLISYIRKVDPSTEAEIYAVLSQNSTIRKIRPPFSGAFDLDANDFKALYQSFSIYDWATALLDSPHEIRTKIKSLMNEKEQFLLSDAFKNLNQSSPTKSAIADIRERIGVKAKQLQVYRTLNKKSEREESDEGADIESNDQTAA